MANLKQLKQIEQNYIKLKCLNVKATTMETSNNLEC